ncbi:hypothetical protein IW262DRAFT_1276548 [Armillaria fumosa]|nr:hypothetical protein IW262DRAFT_1276548 [Armillaria fumosa]
MYKCQCPCRDHCICLSKHGYNHTCNECGQDCKCECGSRRRYGNLVACLDGTSNQFGRRNSNVVELHDRILKDDPDVLQLTFYSSGIGTYVPSSTFSLAHLRHNLDTVFAGSFKRLVEEAYMWIADHYKPGDRLFLFGFVFLCYCIPPSFISVIQLGLVGSGNKSLIPLQDLSAISFSEAEAESLAENFKHTFGREVKVHFVGVWDTVSSVGIVPTHPLPYKKSASHTCFFRHELALDERRVKFLPEYLAGGRSLQTGNEHYGKEPPNAKEVWFPGRHSDICHRGHTIDLTRVPLLWMENEAGAAGLKLAPRRGGIEWRWDYHHVDKPKNKLSWLWWTLEYLPLKRLKYTDKESTTWIPHLGRGRFIVPPQLIHASLAFKQNYIPTAVFFGTTKMAWKPLIGIGS